MKFRRRKGTNTNNSHIKVWAAREGQNFDLLIDRPDRDPGNGPAHNTLWLLPYDTGKQANPSRKDTYTLYDVVIVSLNDIASPGGTAPTLANLKPGLIDVDLFLFDSERVRTLSSGPFFWVRPSGRTYSGVKVLYWPDKGSS